MALIISYWVMISILPLPSSTSTAMLSLLIILEILSMEVFISIKGNGAVDMLLIGCDLMPGFSINESRISLSVILPMTIPFWVTGIWLIFSDLIVFIASKT